MQDELAVREAYRLRRPGRPAGIESRRQRIFVEIGECRLRRSGEKQRFVFANAPLGERRFLAVHQRHDRTDAGQRKAHPIDQRQKVAMHQQHLGTGMRQGILQLFRRQSEVGGLQHRSHHRDGK